MVENKYFVDNEIDPPLVSATQVGAEVAGTDSTPTEKQWQCPQCTLINPSSVQICEVCNYCSVVHVAEQAVTRYLEDPTPEEFERAKVAAVHTGYACQAAAINSNPSHPSMTECIENPRAKYLRRRRRRMRMVAGGGVGAIAGSILLCGPIGAVVGGIAGATIARGASKRCQRKSDMRMTAYAQAKELPGIKATAGI